jgi:hypothetical protein
MKFRMDRSLRFWVDCSYQEKKYEDAKRTRAELIAEILRDYERSGDAMRYLNGKGSSQQRQRPVMLPQSVSPSSPAITRTRSTIRRRVLALPIRMNASMSLNPSELETNSFT